MLIRIVMIHISRIPKMDSHFENYDSLKVLERSKNLWNQMYLQIELPCSHSKGFKNNFEILGLHAQNK
jgi:hypothetical protein